MGKLGDCIIQYYNASEEIQDIRIFHQQYENLTIIAIRPLIIDYNYTFA